MSTNFYTPDGKHVGKQSGSGMGKTHFTFCTHPTKGAGESKDAIKAKVKRCKFVRGDNGAGKMEPETFERNVLGKASSFSVTSQEFS